MSATSDLYRALEPPHDRQAELALASWLLEPDLKALRRTLPAPTIDHARRLGVVLEGSALLGLIPRSPELELTIARLARDAGVRDGSTLQERWSVPSLPFDFGRLKLRMREMRAVAQAKRSVAG